MLKILDTEIRTAPIIPLDTKLGPVHIAITSAKHGLRIWRDVVGLTLIEQTEAAIHLGINDKVLIVLELTATGPVVEHTTGLYHVAIHVPFRADLARFILRATEEGLRVSPTDHLVTEAVYAWDWDGNGIEMTFETPWRGKLGNPTGPGYGITADGEPHSGREPIDLEGLMAELDGDPNPRAPLPSGTRIGHVHVHVTDLDQAMRFYRDVLGFGGLMLLRDWGIGDVGLDYMPHTLAFNIWAGPGAKPAPEGAAGLRHFTIIVPDEDAQSALAARLEEADMAYERIDGVLHLTDPFANPIRIAVAS